MFAGNLWILLKSWLRAGVSYPIRAVARAGEIPVGGVKLFEYPGPEEQCILVRTSEESYVAYSQKRTHLSCAVYYSAPDRRLECPCHRGYFSIEDGSVLQGPPTQAPAGAKSAAMQPSTPALPSQRRAALGLPLPSATRRARVRRKA